MSTRADVLLGKLKGVLQIGRCSLEQHEQITRTYDLYTEQMSILVFLFIISFLPVFALGLFPGQGTSFTAIEPSGNRAVKILLGDELCYAQVIMMTKTSASVFLSPTVRLDKWNFPLAVCKIKLSYSSEQSIIYSILLYINFLCLPSLTTVN